MSDPNLITGMGAALVDLFADVSEAELAATGSPKASMSLVEADRSAELQGQVRVTAQRPGGSAANSIAGIAALGLPAGFVGRIGDDALGRVFADDFAGLNVAFPAAHRRRRRPADRPLSGAGDAGCRTHHAHGLGRSGDDSAGRPR